MSLKAMSAAFEVGDRLNLSATDRLILLRLGDWSDDSGYCWPGLEDLSAKVGVDKRSIRRRLSALEEAALLVRVIEGRGRGRTTLYRILPEFLPDSEDAPARIRYFSRFRIKEDTASGFPETKRGPASAEKRTAGTRKEDTGGTKRGHSSVLRSIRIQDDPSGSEGLSNLLDRIPVPKTDREGNPIRNPNAYRKKVASSPGVLADLEVEEKAERARQRGPSDLKGIGLDPEFIDLVTYGPRKP